MKQLLDIVPVILFFAAYKFYDIYVATAVLMAATVAQMGVIWLMERRLEAMHKVTLVLILVFGSLTLVLQDESFIKWKPTVLYSAMAITLGVAYWGYRKNFLKLMLDKHLTLPDRVWGQLTVAWIGYALFMAALNGYVALFFSTEFWVNFKLWGYAFPLVFLVGQALYLSRFMKSDEASKS